MKRNHTRYRALLAAISAAAITSLVGVPVLAADTAKAAPTEELTEVIVTGSLLRRTDTETPSPVTVMTAESMQERGINTVAEAVQRLSANGSGTLSSGWSGAGFNFAGGANAVSLRGLTVQATLSIFDGLRMAPYPLADDGHRNFVDLNTIPDAVVERIEILKDGASSLYGADAIAGVVNVITKKEVTGIHLNASHLITIAGGGAESRADATWGIGKLNEQGYNFYINAEYQKTGAIRTNQRSYPFGTSDLSRICNSLGNCLANGTQFGINADGTLGAGTTTSAPLVAPATISAATGLIVRGAPYQLLNTAAGCNVEPGLSPVTLTAAQAGTTWNPTQCQQDLRSQFQLISSPERRVGAFTRFTAKIGSSAEFYAAASYYNIKAESSISPLGLANNTAAPTVVTLSPVVLPVFVCSAGVGTIALNWNASTGCNAGNGVLNPNNPFAAAGSLAILRWRYDRPRTTQTDAKSTRGAIGIAGVFGDAWHYSTDLTVSQVKLEVDDLNYLIPQRIANVVAQGTFNFVNPLANSESIRAYIAPPSIDNSVSKLTQWQGTINRKLATLAGGDLQAAVGVAYRKESIDNPSANPDNQVTPYTRYYSVNAVGAVGSRNVKSGFFEIGAPFVKQLEVNVSGRYDKYSSGQSNFSPKLGVKYKPIDKLALRGTYSKGFRIPSFNESFGLPTTGYSNTQISCTPPISATFAAFCAAHASNAYASSPYSIGTTLTGNPSLKPEKSSSFTLGLVFEPINSVSLIVDYWNIEVKDLVGQVASSDRTAAISQYYANNGVVNIPGISVTQGVPDPAFPNALPLLGTINASYNNAGKENASGIDFGVNATVQVAPGVKWSSAFDASYLLKYTLTHVDGSIDIYQGTLGPCDYTSCSGSPRWRGSWQNTLAFDKLSVTGTLYYTSGYNLAEIDYGADVNDCTFNSVNGVGAPTYKGTNLPSACSGKNTWNLDLNGRYKATDKVTVYLDVLNVLGIQAPFDPAAAYSLTQYNPAWAQENIIGRAFRLGVKADF